MVSIRAMEMHIQGEQAILAKLKIIVMCHREVADYDFFWSYYQGQEGRTKDLFQFFHVCLE